MRHAVLALIMCGATAHAACVPAVRPMSFSTRGDTVYATGQIVAGSAGILAGIVAAGRTRTLVVDSNGGDTGEGAAMADVITANRLDVSVPHGMCASSCFMLLAAGKTKTVSRQSEIGVHRAASCNDDAVAAQLWTIVMAGKAEGYGVTRPILELMLTVQPPGIAWLHADELAAMGVRIEP